MKKIRLYYIDTPICVCSNMEAIEGVIKILSNDLYKYERFAMKEDDD